MTQSIQSAVQSCSPCHRNKPLHWLLQLERRSTTGLAAVGAPRRALAPWNRKPEYTQQGGGDYGLCQQEKQEAGLGQILLFLCSHRSSSISS